MPGFVLEEGFQLARFQNTIGSTKLSNKFIVDLNTLTSLPNDQRDTETVDDSNQVVVTIQGEGIKLYNTTVQKCLKSWTTPPGILFAHPAIYYPATGDETLNYTYALVDSGSDITPKEERKTIWMWKDAQSNEEIASSASRVSKKFDKRIQAVHVSPSLRFNVILVNEDGSIDLVAKDLDRVTANCNAPSGGKVVWSTVFVTTSSHVRPCCVANSMVPANSTIVVTICESEKVGHYEVKLHYINEERRSINVVAKVDVHLQSKSVAFTLDPTLGILTILESDGTWTVNHLALKHRVSNKIAAHLEQRFKTHFNNYQVYDEKLGDIASMDTVTGNFVAIVAPRRIKKGTNQVEHVVSVWDVKYGTLQAEQVIKLSDKLTASNEFICKVSVLRNSHIAVTISSIHTKSSGIGKSHKNVTDAKSTVTLYPYYNQPMSLMAAMNRMKPTAEFLGINMNSLSDKSTIGFTRSGQGAISHNIEFGLDGERAFEKWTARLKKDQKSEETLLNSLMQDDLTKDDFDALVNDYLQIQKKTLRKNLDSKVDEAGKKLDVDGSACLKVYYEFVKNERRKPLSSQFVSLALDRIFAKKNGIPDMKLWSPVFLVYLMAKQQLRSGHIEGGLIAGLVERKAWHLIPVALKSVIDIPETDLVFLIKELVALVQKEPALWETRFSKTLRKVVETHRNDIFMEQALKRLTVSELPTVMKALIQWLQWQHSDMTLHSSQNSRSEKHNNIVNFASVLLDVHFPAIILEPSLHECVATLYMSVTSLCEQVEELDELNGVLAPFERDRKIATKQKSNKRSSKKGKSTSYGEEGIPIYRNEVFQF